MNLLNKAFTSERAFAQVMKLASEAGIVTSDGVNTGGVLVVPQQLSIEDWGVVADENQRKYRGPATHYDDNGNPDLSGPWDDLPTRADKIRARERGIELFSKKTREDEN